MKLKYFHMLSSWGRKPDWDSTIGFDVNSLIRWICLCLHEGVWNQYLVSVCTRFRANLSQRFVGQHLRFASGASASSVLQNLMRVNNICTVTLKAASLQDMMWVKQWNTECGEYLWENLPPWQHPLNLLACFLCVLILTCTFNKIMN